MKNPFKEFRNKYRISVPISKVEVKETPEKEAQRLTGQLDAIMVNAPLYKPYNGDYNRVQLNETCLQWIQEILNTSNQLILENESYQKIRERLQEFLDKNSQGIEVKDIVDISREVKKLFYTMQPQEYWEKTGF